MSDYYIYKSLETILANEATILSVLQKLLTAVQRLGPMLQHIETQEANLAINLDAITAEVANNTSVTNSVVQLVQNLAAQIAAIPPSSDPTTQAALDALKDTLTQNDTTIASTVAANTPAAGPSPASGPRGRG